MFKLHSPIIFDVDRGEIGTTLVFPAPAPTLFRNYVKITLNSVKLFSVAIRLFYSNRVLADRKQASSYGCTMAYAQ